MNVFVSQSLTNPVTHSLTFICLIKRSRKKSSLIMTRFVAIFGKKSSFSLLVGRKKCQNQFSAILRPKKVSMAIILERGVSV